MASESSSSWLSSPPMFYVVDCACGSVGTNENETPRAMTVIAVADNGTQYATALTLIRHPRYWPWDYPSFHVC